MSDRKHRLCLVLVTQVLMLTVCAGRTMDEMIANAAETPEMFAMPAPRSEGRDGQSSVVRVEMDIVYTPQQYRHLMNSRRQAGNEHSRRHGRKAIRDKIYRWPDTTIPYDYDTNSHFTDEDKDEIRSALEEWKKYTCLKLVPAQQEDTNRVRFTNGGGCFSNVGMVGNAQVIGLAKGCRRKPVVIHELGHAVGFQHEQTRPDRDDHVTILPQNIPPNLLYNFHKYNTETVDLFRTTYDYQSIMHYGKKAFSYNQQLTIVTKDRAYQDVIGTATGLSFTDIKLANLMYRCDARCTEKVQCPSEGFVDKNCQCVCPGQPTQPCSDISSGSGSQSATTTTTRTQTSSKTGSGGSATETSVADCKDLYDRCQRWAGRGYCKHPTNRQYMAAYCKQSCNLCDQDGEKEVNDCKDIDKSCEFWKGEAHCTDEFTDFMKTTCPQTCGHCPADGDGDKRQDWENPGSEHRDDVSDSGVTSQAMTSFNVVIMGLTFVRGMLGP